MYEINRGLPTNVSASNDVIRQVLGEVDPVMPESNRRELEAASFLSQFSKSSNVSQRDSQCAAIQWPAFMRDPEARTGCGWWYTYNSMTPSVGAYGSRRGPMNPMMDKQYGPGEWIWNPNDAARRESTKQTSQVKVCKDIDFFKKPGQNMGWCSSMNRAVMTNGDAVNPAALYPNSPGGFCPEGEKIIMTSAECNPPAPSNPDLPATAPVGISSVCDSANGQLSPQCLKSLTNIYCNPTGSLSQALSNGYPSSSQDFNDVNAYLTQRGFSINQGLINDGRLSSQAALSSIQGLRQYAQSQQADTSTSAAMNMCFGTEFNPCLIADTKPPPYDMNCIRKTAIQMGYRSSGKLLQSDSSYWNSFPTWKALVTKLQWWKNLADQGPAFFGGPSDQTMAIQNVYQVSVDFPSLSCGAATLPQLKVWYDGMDPNGDGKVPKDGTPINPWVNKAGIAKYNANAISPAKYSAANKSLYFDGNIYSTGYPANPTAETIFIVFNTPPPTTTNYTAALMSGYTGARGFWVGYTDGAGSGRGGLGILSSDVSWHATTQAGTYTYGKTAIATGRISGGGSTVSVNGGPLDRNTGGANFYPGTTTYIGQQYGAGHTYNFVGYAKEILIYNNALSNEQVQKIEGYLAWKWGTQGDLSYSHPYKTKAPPSK